MLVVKFQPQKKLGMGSENNKNHRIYALFSCRLVRALYQKLFEVSIDFNIDFKQVFL